MAFCSNCGNEVARDARYCSKCRKRIKRNEPHQTNLSLTPKKEIEGFGWYLAALKKYNVFSGRSRRKEYWLFTLFNSLMAIAAFIFDNEMGTTFVGSVYGIAQCLFGLATVTPSLAVTVRRLHDVGKSGWYLLWLFLPLAGAIMVVIQLCFNGTTGDNEYGQNPRDF